jgi:16S rRNA (guanine(527)-N(7))-methyltransferase RsmG
MNIPEKPLQLLIQGLKSLKIDPDKEILKKFDIFFSNLLEWNNRFNLTAIRDASDIVSRHFLDSLTLFQSVDMNEVERAGITDIGSGAGFPGMPVKIILPGSEAVFIERTGKKAQFIRHLINTLDLKRCRIINENAEEYFKRENAYTDIFLMRATGTIEKNMRVVSGLFKKSSDILTVMYKGTIEMINPELEVFKTEYRSLNYRINPVKIPGMHELKRHHLLIHKKSSKWAI